MYKIRLIKLKALLKSKPVKFDISQNVVQDYKTVLLPDILKVDVMNTYLCY